jgi:hypothetical protein
MTYRLPWLFRWGCALFFLACAAISPIGGALGGTQLLPSASPASAIGLGLVVGGSLALAFIYLAIRIVRSCIMLTENAVVIRGFAWNTTIVLERIASIELETRYNEGSLERVYFARDDQRRQLFAVADSGFKFANAVRVASAEARNGIQARAVSLEQQS